MVSFPIIYGCCEKPGRKKVEIECADCGIEKGWMQAINIGPGTYAARCGRCSQEMKKKLGVLLCQLK
jgi:hypothetical protein